MRAFTAIGINNNFTPCDTAVSHRSTDHKTAGRVDKKLGLLIYHMGWQDRFDDLFHNPFFQVFIADILIVLGREHHCIYRCGNIINILYGYLAFGIRAQPWQSSCFAYIRLLLG